jgi:O-antigen/teichoic acid export membrane protein
MQKKFFSNLLLLMLLNLLIKPVAIFGIDTWVQNRVGAETYGLYFSLLNLSLLFNILMDLGINNFTTKNVAQFPHIVSRYLGKVLIFRLFLFFIYTIVTFGMAFLLGYDSINFGILCFLVFNQFLVVLIAYLRSHFAGLLYFKWDALFSVMDRLLLIFLCGYVLMTTMDQEFKIEWFVWIQTICYALTLATAFLVLMWKIGRPKFRFDFVFSLAIVRKSFPYALLILLMMFYTRQDSIMLERLHENGAFQAGVYAQGFRLLDAFYMFGMLFTGLLFPLFSHQVKNKVENQNLLLLSTKLLTGGAIVLGIVCYYHAQTILDWIYKNNVSESVEAFQYLMLAFISMSVSLVFGTFLTASSELKFLNRIALVGIVINFSMNYYLIPKYGAAGAAVATMITQVFTATLQMIKTAKYFGTETFFPMLTRFIFLGALLVVLAQFGWNVFVLLSAGILALLLLKVWDLREMKSLLPSLKKAKQ